jgi:hypothetical protein
MRRSAEDGERLLAEALDRLHTSPPADHRYRGPETPSGRSTNAPVGDAGIAMPPRHPDV